jgi:hypothetical protein
MMYTIPGITPRLISGWPNLAFSAAIIMSHNIANSHPPPRAYPDTAAIVYGHFDRGDIKKVLLTGFEIFFNSIQFSNKFFE